MLEKYFNNRFLILYATPFIIGSLSVFSFQPFNITIKKLAKNDMKLRSHNGCTKKIYVYTEKKNMF